MTDAAAKPAGDKKKKANPVLRAVRRKYSQQLKKVGVEGDAAKERIRAFMKDNVRPALKAAREEAKSQSLKGDARDKFMSDAVMKKVGLA